MRKIFGIVVASMMFANIGFAEIRQIESETIGVSHSERYLVSTVCVDGYKFVVAKAGQVHSMGMVQFFEERDGKSLPAKC